MVILSVQGIDLSIHRSTVSDNKLFVSSVPNQGGTVPVGTRYATTLCRVNVPLAVNSEADVTIWKGRELFDETPRRMTGRIVERFIMDDGKTN